MGISAGFKLQDNTYNGRILDRRCTPLDEFRPMT